MRCRQCDYLLFNLTRSECPECNRPFRVDEYSFEPAAVSFHCPHCDQAYYGNDERGLPVPREFTCVTCRRPVTLNELRVVPEKPDAMGFIGSTWDNRHQRGLWPAWWETFKQLLLQPSKFYRDHAGKSIREAWLFSMIALYIGMVPAMCYQILAMWAVLSGSLIPMPAGAAPMPAGFMSLLVVVYVSLALVGPLFIQFVVGGIYSLTIQLGLVVLVPHRRSLETTFRTVLYSFSAYAIYAVPICGSSVGAVWQLVILIVGIKEVHGTTGWRAAIAVLWPIAAIIALYGLLIILLIASTLRGV